MGNFIETLVVFFAICVIIVLAIIVISAPFAFIGWVLLSAANVFSAVAIITYFNSFVVGFAATILMTLVSK